MLTCVLESGGKGSFRHVVADVLVLKRNEILLVKRAGKLLETGKWALVGGFIERNETIADGAAREVLEETGYTVSELTLFRIIDRPDRPAEDRQNIVFVYFCTALEKVGDADAESSEQRWFPLSALPPKKEFAFDHSSDIELYVKYLKVPFTLPVLG